jgi:hypothetical protein
MRRWPRCPQSRAPPTDQHPPGVDAIQVHPPASAPIRSFEAASCSTGWGGGPEGSGRGHCRCGPAGPGLHRMRPSESAGAPCRAPMAATDFAETLMGSRAESFDPGGRGSALVGPPSQGLGRGRGKPYSDAPVAAGSAIGLIAASGAGVHPCRYRLPPADRPPLRRACRPGHARECRCPPFLPRPRPGVGPLDVTRGRRRRRAIP